MVRKERELQFKTTDMGNAERLVTRHGHDLRFCEKLNKWFVWNGVRWVIDDSGEVCRKWQAEGLQEPHEIREATADYRSEMDPFGAFLASRCVTDPRASAGATELYKEYLSWCRDADEESVSQKAFGTKLTRAGFRTDQKGPGGRTRRLGIGIKETYAEFSEAPHEFSDGSEVWTGENRPAALTLLQRPS